MTVYRRVAYVIIETMNKNGGITDENSCATRRLREVIFRFMKGLKV